MSVQSEVTRIANIKATLSNYLVGIEEATGSESLDTLIGKAIDIMSSYGDRLAALETGKQEKLELQTQGNWSYKVYGDGTFEAWYSATGQSLTITADRKSVV